VTSVNFNHATNAAFVVKNHYRKNYGEKARQMAYSDVDVIMGAGHPFYDDNGDPRTPDYYGWYKNQGPYMPDISPQSDVYDKVVAGLKGRTFVDAKADFEDLADGNGVFKGGAMPTRVFGLARVSDTLQYDRNKPDGDASNDWMVGGWAYVPNVPTLETMTKGALGVLGQDEDGFFLMVEGGAIDWAGHGNWMTRMLEENIDFDAAVAAVIEWIEDDSNGSNWDNTLLIVTADHETGHLQPPAPGDTGNDIILNECWGVGCAGWGNHTNSLVPIYAQGPTAEVLRAKYDGDYRDNSDIFKIMIKALDGANPNFGNTLE
jgi:alkaline phosphatase